MWIAALLGGTVSTGVHGKGGRRPRRVSVCRTAARPGVPRCIRPTGTTTGPPLDELAVNLASSAGRAAPGGEWIEGRQAAGRGAFESASVVLFFARPPEAPRLPPQEEEERRDLIAS